VPLDKFLRFSQAEYYQRGGDPAKGGDVLQNYAQGWSFIWFLRTTKEPKYQGILDRYFNTLKAAVTGWRTADEEAARKENRKPLPSFLFPRSSTRRPWRRRSRPASTASTSSSSRRTGSRASPGSARSRRPAPGDPMNPTVVVRTTGTHPYANEVAARHHRLSADEPADLGGPTRGPRPRRCSSGRWGPARPSRCACTPPARAGTSGGWRWTSPWRGGARGEGPDPARDPPRGGLDAEQRARLLEIAGKCPVHRTLEAGAEVATELAP